MQAMQQSMPMVHGPQPLSRQAWCRASCYDMHASKSPAWKSAPAAAKIGTSSEPRCQRTQPSFRAGIAEGVTSFPDSLRLLLGVLLTFYQMFSRNAGCPQSELQNRSMLNVQTRGRGLKNEGELQGPTPKLGEQWHSRLTGAIPSHFRRHSCGDEHRSSANLPS